MITLFTRKFREETVVPFNLKYRNELMKLDSNIFKIRERMALSPQYTKSSHQVVQLLNHVYNPNEISMSEHVRVGLLRAESMVNRLGFVTINNEMQYTKGEYIGDQLKEYTMVLFKPYDSANVSWQDLRPLRVHSHPYVTSIVPRFDKPMEEPIYLSDDEEASAFLTLDVAAMIRQYVGYLKAMREIGMVGNPNLYVHGVLLVGMSEDFINLSYLNMGFVRSLSSNFIIDDTVTKHIFQLVPIKADVFFTKKTLDASPSRTVNSFINYLFATGEGMMDTMALYDIVQLGRYRIWTYMAAARNMRSILHLINEPIHQREEVLWRQFRISYKRILRSKLIPVEYQSILDDVLILMEKK